MRTKHYPISMEERQPMAARLGRLCNKVMKQYDLGITGLAKELNVNTATFYQWTKGTQCPSTRAKYNKVITDLQALDLSRAENAHKIKPEKQLDLDFTEPVRSEPNQAETTGVTMDKEPEDALLVLPKKEVLAIVAAGLNKLFLNGNYAVTDVSFEGESGRILFKEK